MIRQVEADFRYMSPARVYHKVWGERWWFYARVGCRRYPGPQVNPWAVLRIMGFEVGLGILLGRMNEDEKEFHAERKRLKKS